MKKRLLALAVAVSCLAAAAGGTVAYFTAEDTAHNVITSGGVNIEVVEKTRDAGGVLLDFPEDGIKGVMPGTDVSKIVSVKNTGASEAWIRVRVEETVRSSGGEELPLELENGVPVMSYTPGEDWTLSEDGWYYCEKPVPAGQSTGVLFDTVSFAPEMGNEYQNCTANLLITAQAVQTANNGETALTAAGWPE